MKLSSELLAEITACVTIVGRDEPRPADRRSPRVRLSSHLFAFNWEDPSTPFGIRVQNLSEGGVGILHHQRIPLDQKLVVRFPRYKDRQLLLLGKVVFWEPITEKLYSVGIQFDRVVEQSELDEQTARPAEAGGVLSRLTQALGRTWRAAS
jgi:hypothetical protein